MEVEAELVIPVGEEVLSGMKMTAIFGSERGHHAKLTYGFDNAMEVVENPSKKRFQFDLHPIDPARESEKLMFAR